MNDAALSERLWGSPDYRARWRWLLGLLDAQPGERVLDVGCGTGASTRFVTHRVGTGGISIGLERKWEHGTLYACVGRV